MDELRSVVEPIGICWLVIIWLYFCFLGWLDISVCVAIDVAWQKRPFDSSRRGADARSGRDVGPVASKAVTFENDTMPGAQFFLNEQEETAVTEATEQQGKSRRTGPVVGALGPRAGCRAESSTEVVGAWLLDSRAS